MRRFYAPLSSFAETTVTLDEGETRHLRNVIRLRPGDEAYVIDGEGREFLCRVDTIAKRHTVLSIIEAGAPSALESPLDLTLAAAVLKGDNFDLVVQKAVELGVTRLIPLDTERGDVKIRALRKRLERWNRIVLEASKQCGRAKLMQIEQPQGLVDVLKGSPGGRTLIVFAESGGVEFPARLPNDKLTAVIGPAGGWSPTELETVRSTGSMIVTLGTRVLRAETAAISVAAILQHRFGDLN